MGFNCKEAIYCYPAHYKIYCTVFNKQLPLRDFKIASLFAWKSHRRHLVWLKNMFKYLHHLCELNPSAVNGVTLTLVVFVIPLLFLPFQMSKDYYWVQHMTAMSGKSTSLTRCPIYTFHFFLEHFKFCCKQQIANPSRADKVTMCHKVTHCSSHCGTVCTKLLNRHIVFQH